MENKINIAELLIDCPTGMELDCTMYEKVQLDYIKLGLTYPIKIQTPDGQIGLTKYGCYSNNEDAKCVIFPKGKTTWEGFQIPFKDGDVISIIINKNLWYGIYQKEFNAVLYCYVDYSTTTKSIYLLNKNGTCLIENISEIRFATEEEKEKLFKAIKDNGYRWNEENKTLEKLAKFKVGDRIKHKCEKFRDERTIISYGKSGYWTTINDWIDYKNQDNWELVPNKFDITTLKTFDRVLVRCSDNGYWQPQFFSKFNSKSNFPFQCTYNSWSQCIPYEGNEHLSDTTNDCDEFYKTWK